ncbi:hypothetical protein SCLCIDRAFT_293650 [Scleroderma citrinum Foug A]|uniref:Uncharacterized protein n=1 Tax=Scleroderma citrinum Foug A TaxID=1036808 RepID=A0A0C3AP07_9AGAM|nr:hypothetical protein SCLCIDRAFT_293650 [Scleroderma citrinum Foug A]
MEIWHEKHGEHTELLATMSGKYFDSRKPYCHQLSIYVMCSVLQSHDLRHFSIEGRVYTSFTKTMAGRTLHTRILKIAAKSLLNRPNRLFMVMNIAALMDVVLNFFAIGGKHRHRFATPGDRRARRRLTIQENSSSSATRQV